MSLFWLYNVLRVHFQTLRQVNKLRKLHFENPVLFNSLRDKVYSLGLVNLSLVLKALNVSKVDSELKNLLKGKNFKDSWATTLKYAYFLTGKRLLLDFLTFIGISLLMTNLNHAFHNEARDSDGAIQATFEISNIDATLEKIVRDSEVESCPKSLILNGSCSECVVAPEERVVLSDNAKVEILKSTTHNLTFSSDFVQFYNSVLKSNFENRQPKFEAVDSGLVSFVKETPNQVLPTMENRGELIDKLLRGYREIVQVNKCQSVIVDDGILSNENNVKVKNVITGNYIVPNPLNEKGKLYFGLSDIANNLKEAKFLKNQFTEKGYVKSNIGVIENRDGIDVRTTLNSELNQENVVSIDIESLLNNGGRIEFDLVELKAEDITNQFINNSDSIQVVYFNKEGKTFGGLMLLEVGDGVSSFTENRKDEVVDYVVKNQAYHGWRGPIGTLITQNFEVLGIYQKAESNHFLETNEILCLSLNSADVTKKQLVDIIASRVDKLSS